MSWNLFEQGVKAQAMMVTLTLLASSGSAQNPNPGRVWAWGSNLQHQLSQGTGISSRAIINGDVSGAGAIAAGGYHSLALKSDGAFVGWGGNADGQLCNGTLSSNGFPQPVAALAGAVAIAGGGIHTLVLKPDGSVVACGHNAEGQLGNGTNNYSPNPVAVSGLSGVTAIAAGAWHSLALKSDGTVWAWGDNLKGELGDGTTTSRNTPVQVSGLSGVIAIAGGGAVGVAPGEAHSLALKSDGTVWAWGDNTAGQLGDGTNTNRSTPGQVSGLSGVVAIAAGGGHNLALKPDGTVWAWGRDTEGQLGDGATANRTTPVQVPGLSGVAGLAAGELHSLALKADGTVWAWGLNSLGQLGNGTSSNQSSVPGQVLTASGGNLGGAVRITAGGRHSLAVTNPLVEVSPVSLTFGKILVGGLSAAQLVNITNRGPDALIVSSLGIGGANPADFTVAGPPLPITVAVGASIAASVRFAPTARGARAGTLLIGDNGFKSPQTVSLSGTGVSIQDLIDTVGTLSLSSGEINSLLVKLYAAQESLARGNQDAARSQLNAFVEQVNALNNSGRLPSSTAQDLIAAAQTIISSIPPN